MAETTIPLRRLTHRVKLFPHLNFSGMDSSAIPSMQIGTKGSSMPAIGFGTWRSPEDGVKDALRCAIEAGYRHIDCARAYLNEASIGCTLQEQISRGVVKREDMFITSKLWNTFHSAEDVKPSLQESLNLLGLKYLDLYLIHWPTAYQRGGELFPKDKNGNNLYADTHYLETWKAMEKCVDEGLVKHIGVSNFNSVQIQDIIDNCRIKPAVSQVEIHPYFSQEKLVKFCQDKNIIVTAYSPLASTALPGATLDSNDLLGEPALKNLATKYKKSPAQIVLRWLFQRSIVVIPKSVTPSRIKENIQILDFQLTADDMKIVNGLNKNERLLGLYKLNKDGTRDFVDKAAPNFPFPADVEF